MTSAILARYSLNHRQERRGFTLVEILIVIAIIVILVGLLTPMVMKAFRSAGRARIAADLNTISTALEAYKADFGDYPRPAVGEMNTGFAVLCKALIGPYGDGVAPPANDPPIFASGDYKTGDCVLVGTNPFVAVADSTGIDTSKPARWAAFTPNDGVDGPGFKVRTGSPVKRPYLQPDKFKVQGCAIYDHVGGPIGYFVASPAKPNIGLVNGFVSRWSTSLGSQRGLYNADQNLVFFRRLNEGTDDVPDYTNALRRMQVILGDVNTNGTIDTDPTKPPAETAASTAPFLLWSAGPDGLFGPTEIVDGSNGDYPPGTPAYRTNAKNADICDDVTNFR